MISRPKRVSAIIFDIDGTLLDSATGIIAGFRHALSSVGFTPPSDEVLGSDLGPPVGPYFTTLGLDEARLATAVDAYRSYYWDKGMYAAEPYPDIVGVLDDLSGYALGTATAKRTDTAERFLQVQGLDRHFAVINGTDDQHTTKPETVAHTLERLGDPDPATVLMVGDRHSDIAGGQANGVFSIGVTWGYGAPGELAGAGADALIDAPRELLEFVV